MRLITLFSALPLLLAPLRLAYGDDCGWDIPVAPHTVAIIVGKVARSADHGKKERTFTVKVTEKVLQLQAMAIADERFWTPGSEFYVTGSENTEIGDSVLIAVRRLGNAELSIRTPSIAKSTTVSSATFLSLHDEESARWRRWLDAQRRLADLRKANINEADRETAKSALYLENNDVVDANASFFAALAASDLTSTERDRRIETYCLEHCPFEAMEAHARLMKSDAASPYEILAYKAVYSKQHAFMKGGAKALWRQAHDTAPREIAPMMALLDDALANDQPDSAKDLAHEILKIDAANIPATHALFVLSGETKPADMPLTGLKADVLDLVGSDHHGADMSSMWIGTLRAQNADLEGANLDGLDAQKARRVSRRARNIVFSDAAKADPNDKSGVRIDLTGAKLSGASFRKAKLWALRLEGTSLRGGDSTEADFRGPTQQTVEKTPYFDVVVASPHPDIVDVVFDATRFRDARFVDMRLKHVTFAHVDMAGVVFEGGALDDVDLTTADLAKTTFLHTTYDCESRLPPGFDAAAAGLFPAKAACRPPISLKGRTLTIDMSALDLVKANLSGIHCQDRCDFSQSNLTGADLSEADFSDQRRDVFNDATLDDADLSDARLGNQAYVPPNECGPAIESPTLLLMKAKSLKGAKLARWTISLADIARDAQISAVSSTGEKPAKDTVSSIEKAASKIASADLDKARLTCGWPIDKTSADDVKAVVADIKTLLNKLRSRPGVIIGSDCQ